MKPGIDMKGGSPPTGAWACAPDGRDNLAQAESAPLPNWKEEKRSDTQRPAAIRVTRRLGALAARVFTAWLDPVVAGQWLFATASCPIAEVAIDARVGGSFRFVDRRLGKPTEYSGEYLEIVPHRRLVFTLAMEQPKHAITRVTVEIAPLKKGCELTLTHEHVPRDQTRRIEGRWTGMLYGLAATLDQVSAAFHHGQE